MRTRLCFVIAMLAAGTGVRAADQIGSLKQELALAKRAGLPTTPADMKRHVPASRNAAPFYRLLDQKLSGAPRVELIIDGEGLLGRTNPTPLQIAQGRSELAARKDLMALIHQAASRPDCDFGLDWSQGPLVDVFSGTKSMRTAVRWLKAESGILLWSGKPLEAVRNASLGFRIARHSAAEPTFLLILVATSLDAITLRALENILYHSGDNPGVAAAVRTAIERDWSSKSLSYGLRGEIVKSLVSNQSLRKKGPDLPAERKPTAAEIGKNNKEIDGLDAGMLYATRLACASADKSYPRALAELQRLVTTVTRSKDPRFAQAAIMAPVYVDALPKRAEDTAHAAVLRSAAAVLAWKAAHKRLPDRLDEVIRPAPLDPFDLKPLRYRKEGSGFVVYSVGPSGKFDGSVADPRSYTLALAFRWPMPAVWKQPQPSRNLPRGVR